MPDDLIYQDVLLWSERESALLRRLAAGERVNDAIDWENVIEEIETLGRSELRGVESLLRRAIQHLLKIVVWPHGPVEHWRNEAAAFLAEARSDWTPSMSQRIDIEKVYAGARSLLQANRLSGEPPRPVPNRSPFALADLILREPENLPDIDALLARLAHSMPDADQ